MKVKQLGRTLVYLSGVGVSVLLLLFVVTCTWIGYEIKSKCQDGQREYGGDCSEAMISLLKDENRGYRARNEAIWALGQLGDERALGVLESYYTGEIPEREPLDKVISQYELKKAINLASGGVNLSAIVWRKGF
jgi:hypothetical protein